MTGGHVWLLSPVGLPTSPPPVLMKVVAEDVERTETGSGNRATPSAWSRPVPAALLD